MSGCTCCSADPKCELAITLFNPSVQSFPNWTPPQNWAPQVYDMNVADFTSGFCAQPYEKKKGGFY